MYGGHVDHNLGFVCLPVFLCVQVVGNLVVLNLFLALLLSSFSADNLSDDDDSGEPNSIALSIQRVQGWINWCKQKIATGFSNSPKEKDTSKSKLEPLQLTESGENVNLADDEDETEKNPQTVGNSFITNENMSS